MSEETRLDKAVRVVEELSALLPEARGVLGDIARERRALEQLLADARDGVTAAAAAKVDEVVEAEVARAVSELGEETRKAMDKSVDKVFAEFDRLANLIMTGDDRGRGEHLLDLVAQARARETPTPKIGQTPW